MRVRRLRVLPLITSAVAALLLVPALSVGAQPGSRVPRLCFLTFDPGTAQAPSSRTPAAQAATSATRTIPIVMLSVGDPVGTGLVESLARPGGNVTGVSTMTVGSRPNDSSC